MKVRTEGTRIEQPRHGYGRRTSAGRAFLLFVQIVAVGIIMIGLLNRPNGDLAPSVDLSPHSGQVTTNLSFPHATVRQP